LPASPTSQRVLATLLDMTQSHIPVLAGELIDVIDPQPGEVAVDCTFGGGGHARLIADRIGPAGTLIGVDRDPIAEERFAELSAEVTCRTRFIRADFVTALAQLLEEQVAVDIVYLDLGMSSMQVDTWARGFSYAYDAPLDMRMDSDQELTAHEIVNTWDERRLARLLREYGEERYASQIARAIARTRRRTELNSTQQLVDAIKSAIPVPAQFAGGHPARRTFQALRVAVNDELAQLDAALPEAWELLAPGGRLAAISFHSLEDRRVKRFLVDRARGCVCPPDIPICVCGREPEAELLTRRAIAPTPGEVASNPRSKSAHLRAARKLEVDPR
jgi:16S rRNA (cytosine1402-N4)-methyltransferase